MVGAAPFAVGAQFRAKKQSTDGHAAMCAAPAMPLLYHAGGGSAARISSRERGENMQQEDGVDAALLTLLALLWQARQEAPEKPWSLAKLAKRAGVQMSTLLRQLNALSSAGLVQVATTESGGGSAQLSAAGAALCASVCAPPPAQ